MFINLFKNGWIRMGSCFLPGADGVRSWFYYSLPDASDSVRDFFTIFLYI